MADMIILMFVFFFALALLGFPIAYSLGFAVIAPLLITGNLTLNTAGSWMLQGISSFPLLACPFFILAGNLMEGGGISRRLVDVAKTLIGNVPGGLGMVAAVACVFFGAISGSGPATLAAIGGFGRLVGGIVRHGRLYRYIYTSQRSPDQLRRNSRNVHSRSAAVGHNTGTFDRIFHMYLRFLHRKEEKLRRR